MPQFTIYSAINPYGRVMQVWAKPDHMFPELIAADYPDPDVCITQLIVSTPSFSLASRCFGIQSKLLTDHCVALATSVHTINSELED
jgi:hypothetical protein